MKYDPEERPTFAQIADKMEDLRNHAPAVPEMLCTTTFSTTNPKPCARNGPAPPPSALSPTPPPSPPMSETSGHRNVNDQPSAWKLFKRRIQSTKKS